MALPPQIKSVVQPGKFINVCVYGDPGAGKTRLAGSGGKGTLILRPPVDHTDSILDPDVSEWVIYNWAEFLDAQSYLREHGEEWRWVWLDSISLWQDIGLDDIWQGVLAKKPARGEYGADKPEYGINMFRLAQWVRYTVGFQKFNFGVTAHPAELEDPHGNLVMMPWVQGKQMAAKICGYMNLVTYLEKVPVQGVETPVLHVSGKERYYLKNQYNIFEPKHYSTNPTIPKIEAAIRAARPAAKAAPTTTRTRRVKRNG